MKFPCKSLDTRVISTAEKKLASKIRYELQARDENREKRTDTKQNEKKDSKIKNKIVGRDGRGTKARKGIKRRREAITSNGRNYEQFEKLYTNNGNELSKLTRIATDNDIGRFAIRDAAPVPPYNRPIYTPSLSLL